MRITGAKRKLVLTLEEWLRIKWAVERDTIRILQEKEAYESILKNFNKDKEAITTEDCREGRETLRGRNLFGKNAVR